MNREDAVRREHYLKSGIGKRYLKNRLKRFLFVTGFTLIEILTVICIIIILVGLLSPALRKAREQANIQKARAMISSLEVAVNMYYTDIGSYPTTGTLSLLIPATGTVYMDNKDYDTGGFKDPWWTDANKRYYQYQTTAPSNVGKNPVPANKPFYLWSTGPDNTDKNDDIVNW